MDEDAELVRRAQVGDRGAFEELVRRTTRAVYARLYLEVGNVHDAEDLTQETYLRAFRSIGQVKDPSGFRSWLFTVAQSAALDFHRRLLRKRRGGGLFRRAEAGRLAAVPAPEGGGGAEAEERRQRVRAALASLPEEYRLPLAMRYLQGEGYAEISRALSLANGSLKGILHEGLSILRRQLGTEEGGVA